MYLWFVGTFISGDSDEKKLKTQTDVQKTFGHYKFCKPAMCSSFRAVVFKLIVFKTHLYLNQIKLALRTCDVLLYLYIF